eukprot:gene1976-biopygen3480
MVVARHIDRILLIAVLLGVWILISLLAFNDRTDDDVSKHTTGVLRLFSRPTVVADDGQQGTTAVHPDLPALSQKLKPSAKRVIFNVGCNVDPPPPIDNDTIVIAVEANPYVSAKAAAAAAAAAGCDYCCSWLPCSWLPCGLFCLALLVVVVENVGAGGNWEHPCCVIVNFVMVAFSVVAHRFSVGSAYEMFGDVLSQERSEFLW